jgi:hypothetical protein
MTCRFHKVPRHMLAALITIKCRHGQLYQEPDVGSQHGTASNIVQVCRQHYRAVPSVGDGVGGTAQLPEEGAGQLPTHRDTLASRQAFSVKWQVYTS